MKIDDIKKCHICGCYEAYEAEKHLTEKEFDDLFYDDKIAPDLVKCEVCGEWTCDADEQEGCGEVINYDLTYCNKCIKKLGSTDCSKCSTDVDECYCAREYSYIVGYCPDYNGLEEE